MKQQSGFTLIELVVVIVILGILSATALPKFVDLKADADKAAIAGVAGGLSSAASVNYAARLVNTNNGVAIANCADVSNAMQSFPTDGFIIDTSIDVTNGGLATNCLVSKKLADGSADPTVTANFTALGIS